MGIWVRCMCHALRWDAESTLAKLGQGFVQAPYDATRLGRQGLAAAPWGAPGFSNMNIIYFSDSMHYAYIYIICNIYIIMYSILRYLFAKISMRLGGDFDPNISCQTWQTHSSCGSENRSLRWSDSLHWQSCNWVTMSNNWYVLRWLRCSLFTAQRFCTLSGAASQLAASAASRGLLATAPADGHVSGTTFTRLGGRSTKMIKDALAALATDH